MSNTTKRQLFKVSLKTTVFSHGVTHVFVACYTFQQALNAVTADEASHIITAVERVGRVIVANLEDGAEAKADINVGLGPDFKVGLTD